MALKLNHQCLKAKYRLAKALTDSDRLPDAIEVLKAAPKNDHLINFLALLEKEQKSTIVMPLNNPHLVGFKNCQNWIKSKGGNADAFRMKYISESNRCTSAAYDITAGETVCFLPNECMIQDTEPGQLQHALPLKMEYEISLGTNSEYHPYFCTLPQDLSECSNLWSEETLR